MKKEITVIFNEENFPETYVNDIRYNKCFLINVSNISNDELMLYGVISLKWVLRRLGFTGDINNIVGKDTLFWTDLEYLGVGMWFDMMQEEGDIEITFGNFFKYEEYD